MNKDVICVHIFRCGHKFMIEDMPENGYSMIIVSCFANPEILTDMNEKMLMQFLKEEEGRSRHIKFNKKVLEDGSFCISGSVMVRDASVFLRSRIVRSLMTASLCCMRKAVFLSA